MCNLAPFAAGAVVEIKSRLHGACGGGLRFALMAFGSVRYLFIHADADIASPLPGLRALLNRVVRNAL